MELATGVIPGTADYPHSTMAVDAAKIVALNASLMEAGWRYGSGNGIGKICPRSLQATDVPEADRLVDCSGEVAWLFEHATKATYEARGGLGAGIVNMPDGSVNQRDWLIAQGFKRTTLDEATAEDGIVRILVLTPDGADAWCGNASERHIAVAPGDGFTCESHGSHGPDRRRIADLPFLPYLEVYVIALARAA